MKSIFTNAFLFSLVFLFACGGSEQNQEETSEDPLKEKFVAECQVSMAEEFSFEAFDSEAYCNCAYEVMDEYYDPETMGQIAEEQDWETLMDQIYQQEGEAFLSKSQGCILSAIESKDMLLSEIDPEFYDQIVGGCIKQIDDNDINLPRTSEEYCSCYIDKIKDKVTVGDWYASVSDPSLLPQTEAYECLGMIMPPEQ